MDGVDSWGLFERRAEGYPVLDGPATLELWLRWREAGGAARERYYDELIGSLWRLAKKIVNDKLTSRNVRLDAEHYADLASEANVGLVEGISGFDPDKGVSLINYVAAHVERRVSSSLDGGLDPVWSKVQRIAHGVQSSLAERLGRTPRLEEVRVGVEEHCLNWARERLVEAGKASDDEAARAKLVRQGIAAAIGRLDEVLMAQPGLSLDGTGGLGEHLSSSDVVGEGDETSVVAWLLSSLAPEDRELVELRFGVERDETAKYQDIAARRGVGWVEVRTRVNAALGRMTAPHAHYASLGPISLLDDEPESPSARLRERRVRQTI